MIVKESYALEHMRQSDKKCSCTECDLYDSYLQAIDLLKQARDYVDHIAYAGESMRANQVSQKIHVFLEKVSGGK